MMNKSDLKVAELHETANLLLRRRHWPLSNGLDFLCRNGNFTSKHSVAKIFHLLKAEKALLKT
jgi:hypothetical protein